MAGDGSVAVAAVTRSMPRAWSRTAAASRSGTRLRSALRHSVDLPWSPVGIGVTPDGSRAVVNGFGGVAVVDLSAGRIVGQPLALDAMGGSRAWRG